VAAARAARRARGRPGAPRLLDALLDAVEAQRRLLEEDIDQLWDDFFIESCADWAVPYIGSLLGLPADSGRLEVASAIALRRRKGTPAALEDFGEVLTDWSVRVLEGWQITVWSQRLGHPAAAAHRVLRPARRLAVPGRDAVRARRRSVTPGKAVVAARGDRRRLAVGRCGTYLETELAPLLGQPLRPPSTRAPRRRSTCSRGRAAVERRRRRRRDARGTGDELDAPCGRPTAWFEALRRGSDRIRRQNWKVDPAASPRGRVGHIDARRC
jgi:hypothetical protein